MLNDIRNITKNRMLNRYQMAKLHTFEAVARHQSFASAAEELSVTPSAVSHQINNLEDTIGFKLFHRYHRHIELTADGKKLFNSLQTILDQLNQDIWEIKNQELTGQLTIYSRPSIAQSWLIPKISSFIQKYPYITLNLLTGNEIINFHRHRIDLAIYYDDLIYSDLSCVELMKENITPVCSPAYAEKFELYNNPDRLKNCTILHDSQAWAYDSQYNEWQNWANSFDLELDFNQLRAILFDRSDLAVTAAVQHMGVAMGRQTLIAPFIKTNQLIMPFEKLINVCQQRYYAVTASLHNPKVKAFINLLK
ncbi:LysR family D-serine deaminase transcriptional activator [Cricetibacter osteomyelitidis]|uniref:LysR family D-serine deaminase transcriptional activator n=1 Tax=Cricetibacter osteomyelitidis TaxID=1521931 RepID=A0A4R2SWV2_9PAST|nr:DNA-binding transcriptional regulator DsdC [Cricetibacter osteomyelitidis]TCP93371.1 LysR family D-serine deaminase transcriptional activator [Cricetibacter osteomyelitidis]